MPSLCSAYWQVVLTQGVCVDLGSGLVFVPSVAVGTAVFSEERAIAVGIASSASTASNLGKWPPSYLYFPSLDMT